MRRGKPRPVGHPVGSLTGQADRWRSPQVDPEGRKAGGSHLTQALPGGRGDRSGRTLPTTQPELSIALTEKPSGKNTHTQNSGFFPKPLISSNCAVSAHQQPIQRKWWEAGP